MPHYWSRSSSARRSLSQRIRDAVFREFYGNAKNGKCLVCKRPVTNVPRSQRESGYEGLEYQCSHIVSRCNGGSDDISNLVVCCEECNGPSGMWTMNLMDWLAVVSPSELPRIRRILEQHDKSF